MPMADKPLRTISVQQHTLTIRGNGVPNTIPISPVAPAPQNNTNASDGEGVNFENKHQATDGDVTEMRRCDTGDRPANATSAASRNFDAYQLLDTEDPEVTAKNKEQLTPHQIETQRPRSIKSKTRFYSV